jgi:glycosyltransferase involved in cell wall biosynthesis
MKILNVNHILETSGGGGTAERTLQMSYFLAEENMQCHILCTDLFLSEKTKQYLKKIKILALPCISTRFLIPKLWTLSVNNLVKSADIIHLMNHWSFINAWIYFLARWYNKPYVVCPAGSLAIFGRSKIIKKIYNFVIGKRIIKNAACCIAVTEKEISQFLEYGVSREKISIIPNGVRDAPLISMAAKNNFLAKHHINNRQFILFIGRLNLIKGPDLLVQAFEKIKDRFPEYDLVIAGPDEGLLSFIQNYLVEHHLVDRVKIIGSIQGEEKESAYQAASILVIPSRQEAMSIVVLEAGVYGTPAVFTDQCGLGMLKDKGCGVEVPVSVDGIADGISILLADRDASKESGKKLKDYVEQHYNWKIIVKMYINLYQEIIQIPSV